MRLVLALAILANLKPHFAAIILMATLFYFTTGDRDNVAPYNQFATVIGQ